VAKRKVCGDMSSPFPAWCVLAPGHAGNHRDHAVRKYTTVEWGIRTPAQPGPLPADLALDADGVPDPSALRRASGALTASERQEAASSSEAARKRTDVTAA
jgi:hypothetical protein